jgi:hypothetical protein
MMSYVLLMSTIEDESEPICFDAANHVEAIEHAHHEACDWSPSTQWILYVRADGGAEDMYLDGDLVTMDEVGSGTS